MSKRTTDELENFNARMDKLLSVPYSELKKKLEQNSCNRYVWSEGIYEQRLYT